MRPMLATAVAATELPRGDGWSFEVKWDGFRAFARTRGGRLQLESRTGGDLSDRFAALRPLGAALAEGTVLDGEVVAMVDGRPSFEALASAGGRLDAPLLYVAFDVVVHDGEDVTGLPLTARRELLAGLDLPGCATVSEGFHDGAALLAATREQGLEGVVAKRLASPYRPGVRSRDWLKYAHHHSRSAVVVGWRPATGSSRDAASLVLAAPDATGALRYLGRAGSGISGAQARWLAERLAPLEADGPGVTDRVPSEHARGVRWCRPELVVEVAYRERTGSGQLRHPRVVTVRDDVGADAWEQP